MAKWGEGDPRWIVEERPDATNVNNWHWTEKNASTWSQNKIKQLFENLTIDDASVGSCTINEVDKCNGEAVANNRKGKLIFFFEWELKFNWSGKVIGSEEEVKGTIEIPNLSEENDPSEVDVNIMLETTGEESDLLKEFLRTNGTEIIRQKLEKYICLLKEEFAQGMILPKKENGSNPTKPPAVKLKKTVLCDIISAKPTGKLELKTLTLTEKFKCRAVEFYNVLTIPEMVRAFTQCPAKLDVQKGGMFEFFDGNIYGTFEEVVPEKKIVQLWRMKSWPSGHYSKVVLTFDEQEDCTQIKLVQTSIPINEYEKTKEGWHRYYWESIKRTFGFGAFIL